MCELKKHFASLRAKTIKTILGYCDDRGFKCHMIETAIPTMAYPFLTYLDFEFTDFEGTPAIALVMYHQGDVPRFATETEYGLKGLDDVSEATFDAMTACLLREKSSEGDLQIALPF